MKTLLWILQVPLALLYFSGGAYKLFSFDELATMPATAALSRGGWGALGVVEMAGAVLLIVPLLLRWKPMLTPVAATVLAVESFALAALFSRYSLQLAATNPLVWTLPMGLVAAFVAYGRYTVDSTTHAAVRS